MKIVSNSKTRFQIVDLPFSAKKFIVEMSLKKVLTSKTQTCFNSYFSYAHALGFLRRHQIIEEHSKTKSGMEKAWRLTNKGSRLAKIFIEMQEIFDNKLEVIPNGG